MTIEKILGKDALKIAKKNNYSKYPTPLVNSERLYPSTQPVAHPSFGIEKNHKIFTIGSCFAREVDKALTTLGFDVVSRPISLNDVHDGSELSSGDFNKYNIHSILYEFNRAFGLDDNNSDIFLPSGDQWMDAQMGGNFKSSLPVIKERRRKIDLAMAQIMSADLVIVTLGLAETWYCKHYESYLNLTPPVRSISKEPDRYELHVLDYNEILCGLNEMRRLLVNHNPNIKIMVTVSPVPLLSTFRDQDVLVANMYSKSVQRAAVEEFVRHHENVDYFVSYEFVTLGNTEQNWANDYRHVHPKIVRRIMASVLSNYIDDFDVSIAAKSDEVNNLFLAKKYDELLHCYENKKFDAIDNLALYRIGLSYKKKNNFNEAKQIFEKCLVRDPDNSVVQKNLDQMKSKLDKISTENE